MRQHRTTRLPRSIPRPPRFRPVSRLPTLLPTALLRLTAPTLRLPEAQELDPRRPPRVRQRLLHAVQIALQVLVARPARICLRDLRVEVGECARCGRGDVPAERLVHELDFKGCLGGGLG